MNTETVEKLIKCAIETKDYKLAVEAQILLIMMKNGGEKYIPTDASNDLIEKIEGSSDYCMKKSFGLGL